MKEEMSHRFQRLLGLVSEIQSQPGQSTQELAEKFGTSKRNLFRDIKLLQDTGFDIRNDGGYRIEGGGLELPQLPEPGLQPWSVPGAGEVKIVIRVDSQLARILQTCPLHPSQNLKGDRLTLKVTGPDRVLDWLMSVQGAELLEPSWLRGSLQRRAEALVERYR